MKIILLFMPLRLILLFFPVMLLLNINASAQDPYEFTPELKQAYTYLIQLNKDSAEHILDEYDPAEGGKALKVYLEHLADVIPVFLEEEQQQYNTFRRQFGRRLKIIRNLHRDNPWQDYLKAEMQLHSALLYLKFGHKFSAGWDLRDAYRLLRKNHKVYPDFMPDNKSLGLLHIILGSVPDNYQWLLGILNMKGDVDKGKKLLKQAAGTSHPFQLESKIFLHSIRTFMWEEEQSLDRWRQLQQAHQDNLLIHFVYCLALQKMHYTESALHFLQSDLFSDEHFFNIPHYSYIKGELYLQKGNYDKAINHLNDFLTSYKGVNYLKSGHLKMAMAWWIKGNREKTQQHMELIRERGQQLMDGDQYAEALAEEKGLPPAPLLKARLYSDGGYKDKALDALEETDKGSLEHVYLLEYYYRKGRIHHQKKNTEQAMKWYKKTLQGEAPDNLPYYLPNAALQLGYIYREKDTKKARKYFHKAIEYDGHSYENSIENKAKVALEKLE